MDGKELLADYLARNETSQAKLAREALCSEGHLSLFLKGRRGLSPELAKRISEATGGDVPVRALLAEKIEKAAEMLRAAE